MARGQKAPLFMGLRKRLEYMRKQRGWNATELAREAGISRTAVVNIADGTAAPGIDTVERLANALGVSAAWLGFGDAALVELTSHMVAPGFDGLKLSMDLADLVNGAGGHIDQSSLYTDAIGAASWRALTDAYKGLPTKPLAQRIAEIAGEQPIDVVGLGAGMAQPEIGLVRDLAEKSCEHLRLYLMDISHALLHAAFQNAQEALHDTDARIISIEGDFYRLPSFMHFFGSAKTGPRRRLATMFGHTFGNLSNEVLFVRNSLVGFLPGDLLVLDVLRTYAPADKPAQIQRVDPALAGKRPAEFQQRVDEFLTGPIRRHLKTNAAITISPYLDTTSCPVPGSYAIEHRIVAETADGTRKKFSVGHSKRYDIPKLTECMRKEGWELLSEWHYGDAFPGSLCLFKRAE